MKNTKKILTALLSAALSVAMLASCAKTDKTGGTTVDDAAGDKAGNDVKTVGVIQYVSHPSLDNCYAGLEAALKEKYGDNVTIERQIGSDSAADSDCSTFAKQFAAKDVDIMIAIATPAASPAFAASKTSFAVTSGRLRRLVLASSAARRCFVRRTIPVSIAPVHRMFLIWTHR